MFSQRVSQQSLVRNFARQFKTGCVTSKETFRPKAGNYYASRLRRRRRHSWLQLSTWVSRELWNKAIVKKLKRKNEFIELLLVTFTTLTWKSKFWYFSVQTSAQRLFYRGKAYSLFALLRRITISWSLGFHVMKKKSLLFVVENPWKKS